jgi:hypothetical protein
LPPFKLFATLNDMWKKTLPLLILPLLAGCAAQITNLTPRQQARNPNNLYPVEVAFNSQQQALRWDTIKPKIVVAGQSYDMKPTMLMSNRWEGLVPVPPDANLVHYHYRFDFQTMGFGQLVPDNAVSAEYSLKIVEPTP